MGWRKDRLSQSEAYVSHPYLGAEWKTVWMNSTVPAFGSDRQRFQFILED